MVVCVKMMSKGSKEALTVLIVTHVIVHVERVESGVCGLCTQYRYIQCYYDNPVPEINKQLIFAKCCILLHTLSRNRLIKVCSFHVKCVKLNCNLILIIEDFVKLVTN